MADLSDVRAAVEAKREADEKLKTVLVEAFRGGIKAAAIARAADMNPATIRRYVKAADNK